MDEQRFQRAAELFLEARALGVHERAEFLAAACGVDAELRAAVEKLLAGAEKVMPFAELAEDLRPLQAALGSAQPSPASEQGSRIGPYRLLERIGEGGFGTVYMAEQIEPVRRKVALKILKPGMDTKQVIARFEVERQALALMDHPNITRVLDAGTTTTGRPYFVMELVRGVRITEYCNASRLTARKRLELFIPVCQAVQHAHQKGIIHRDLKPSNVLITLHDGVPVPKVIDFGIAKATTQRLTDKTLFTEFRQLIGTPEYMSPEQAEMSGLDIDTRTDIYSLGVLLYELLSGTTPFDSTGLKSASHAEIQRIIREVEPHTPSRRLATLASAAPRSPAAAETGGGAATVPSIAEIARQRMTDAVTLERQLRGDLDWIVMKAIEKDRMRRYATAQDLAMDIERYLRDEPVLAGPPSTLYKVRKFAKRNKVFIATAAVVVVALVAGLLFASYGLMAASAQRDRAMDAERIARDEMERAKHAEAQEHEQRMAAEEARAEEMKQHRIAQENAARADAEMQRAKVMLDLLRGMIASPSLDRARDPQYTVREMLADFGRSLATRVRDQPEIQATMQLTLGQAFLSLASYDDAERCLTRALEIARRDLGPESAIVADALEALGALRAATDDFDGAQAMLTEALVSLRRQFGVRAPEQLRTLGNLVHALVAKGLVDEATSLAREALAIARESRGESHVDTARAMQDLAGVLACDAYSAEAEELQRTALDVRRRAAGDQDEQVADGEHNLGLLLRQKGDLAQAEQHLRTSLETRRAVLGSQTPAVAEVLQLLANVLTQRGDTKSAEALDREALAIRRAVPGSSHIYLAQALSNLAVLLAESGRASEAEPLAAEAVQTIRDARSGDHFVLADTLTNLGSLALMRGDARGAEPLLREALEVRRRIEGSPWALAQAIANLAGALGELEQYEEAEKLLRESLAMHRQLVNGDHRALAATLTNLANVLVHEEDYEAAEPLARESLAMQRRLFGNRHARTIESETNLGRALIGKGDHEEAERLLLEAYESATHAPGGTSGFLVPDLPRLVIGELVKLYEAWGKSDEAARWRARLEAREG